jgi:hypothetical protein
MPTGYTCKVQDGTCNTLREYALNCALAFGALIDLKDDPNPKIPKEIVADTSFEDNQIRDLQKTIKLISKLSIKECDEKAQSDYDNELNMRDSSILKNNAEKANYRKMLDKVDAYDPPTKDHFGLKAFMVQQLSDSIRWDCDTGYYERLNIVKLTGKQWKEGKIKEAEARIKGYKENREDEIKRAKDSNEWLQQLYKSLENS